MGVPEVNPRNHLLHHLKKVLPGPLPDLSGRQGSCRVDDKERAQPVLQLCLPDHRLNLIRQIHDLFASGGADVQDFGHVRSGFSQMKNAYKPSVAP